MRRAAIACLAVALFAGAAHAASTIPGTNCLPFPADSWWHADISALPVHAQSDAWMSNMQSHRNLHPDFGPSYGEIPVPYGIPITVVSGDHARHRVKFQYAGESDKVRYPLGKDSKVEGGQWKTGDRHVIMVRKDNCRLYETWATRKTSTGWKAGSGATWLLDSHALRPKDWTSADAAGLPILPGLLRFDEIRDLSIDHAIRFTTNRTHTSYLWPARHHAGSEDDPDFPPMGARFRLKAGYVINPGLRADTKAVLQAFKTYGLVLADNGSPWYFQGTSDKRWPAGLLNQLKQIPAAAFEAVDTSSLMISEDSMQVNTEP
jgi:hypothetical protein